jgi:hypothetical protein
MDGYASDRGFAPSINTPGIGDYLTAHTVILAHASIYRMYEREFKEEQQGMPAYNSLLRKITNTKFNERKIYVNFNSPPPPQIGGSNYSRRITPTPTR